MVGEILLTTIRSGQPQVWRAEGLRGGDSGGWIGAMFPAVFFDRDGVVNVSPGSGYVLRPADFHLSHGIHAALDAAAAGGYRLVLITSQQGVGKGLMTQAELDAIHERMQHAFSATGTPVFDAIYACTHLEGTCQCRKPSPELILQAAREHSLDLERSIMIGDHDRDILMARKAGVRTTIRIAGHHRETEPADYRLDKVDDLAALLTTLCVPGGITADPGT